MTRLKQPQWLKKTVYNNPTIGVTKSVLREFGLNTVCQSARCPNIFDCFSDKTATFLILGKICSRKCGFCSVEKGEPEGIDEDEPNKIAEAALLLGLKHAVITSVTRDDLSDGGARHFARVIEALRKRVAGKITIEVLIPDFKGNKADIKRVADAGPDIFGHNVETIPRLYKDIRFGADYRRSLDVLRIAKEINRDLITKSAIMLGLGETRAEAASVMEDLRGVDCDMVVIGQYLRPSERQVEVAEFVSPETFMVFKEIGYSFGFKDVQSGPFVRSSYRGGKDHG